MLPDHFEYPVPDNAACLLLNVLQSVELNAPLLLAEAVGTFNVITGVVVPVATVEDKSVPVVPRVNAETFVTVPFPLLLNVFQSVELNAPIVDVLARARDKTCPAKLNPLAVPIVTSPVLVPDPESGCQVPSALKKSEAPPPLSGTNPFKAEVNVLSMAVAWVAVRSTGVAVLPVLLPLIVLAGISANLAFVTTPFVIVVAFPTLVTGPVKFALVVTVAALPVVF